MKRGRGTKLGAIRSVRLFLIDIFIVRDYMLGAVLHPTDN